MNQYRITLLELEKIRPTEDTNVGHIKSLAHAIQISGVWTHPLLVDDKIHALMDGHHRFHAAKLIGLKVIPVALLSYDDNRVRLKAWRRGESYTPEQLREIAVTGALLPQKSTRHVIDAPLPRCCVPLDVLMNESGCGAEVDAASPQPSRAQLLTRYYHNFGRQIGIRTGSAESVDIETVKTQAPHMRLRQMLQNDPAMAALLPAAPGRIALGDKEDAPFFLRATGLMLLPPTLLEDSAALAVAARWGLEASHITRVSPLSKRSLTSVLRQGATLIKAAELPSRNLLLDTIPEHIARELWVDQGRDPSDALLEWQSERIENAAALDLSDPIERRPRVKLETTVEQILISGGDSRLELDSTYGFNRYGVPPRPRPEAVHFSSSTASAVSDYGFMFCDILRRDLLSSILHEGEDETDLRLRAIDATGRAICVLLGLAEDAADVAIAPSGTDVEFLTVMLSLAGADERPLTNILISPAETGRGVKFAGAGRYFDDSAATDVPIQKNAPAWPNADIQTHEIAIRGCDGTPRAAEELDGEVLDIARQALDRGRHVLVHVLASSKTGLNAPTYDTIETLTGLAPDRVDVAVDACQMRTEFDILGGLINRGWMLQISGSKFLTGPPFSGALVLPIRFRDRVERVANLLEQAPGIGRSEDWTSWWAERLPRVSGQRTPSFGPVFRWLPAILEAQLLTLLPTAMRRWAFESFREAISTRLKQSKWLKLIDDEVIHSIETDASNELSRLSIVSFQVLGNAKDGELLPLDESACREIFELLNIDTVNFLGKLSPAEKVLAAQQSHIGQPVTLMTEDGPFTILRMVLGARFFTIVGHAGAGSVEAALESEISDALRAIGKLELLASRWWRLSESGGAP